MIAESSLKCLASGFSFLEGPVWLDPGSRMLALTRFERGGLLFSDIERGRLYVWSDGEIDVFREDSQAANGNALDRSGSLLTCEHRTRRVTRTDDLGGISVVADSYEGKRLNSPNDVVVHRDGNIYFTDPPYGVAEDERELKFQGLFRADSNGARLKLLASNFIRPNGLAFSIDYDVLYVADTERCHIRALRLVDGGDVQDDSVFCNSERPDGLRIDREGNLYVAAMDGVEVFDSSGEKIAAMNMPLRPANLAFGGPQKRSLFICARHSLYQVETKTGSGDGHDC